MKEIVIVSAVRTPIGKFGGSFLKTPAVTLGKTVIEGALSRTHLSHEDVDYVIMGNVVQAGLGQNPARQASVLARIPVTTPAFTVNDMCGSGLKSIHLGMQSILLGESRVVVVGGFENLSLAPYVVTNARFGAKLQALKTEDAMIVDGYTDAFSHEHMGVTAEHVAQEHGITREAQDAFALESQRRAASARRHGLFDDEIVGVDTPYGLITQDEFIREDTSIEKLARLKPAFLKDGTVTAGNASGINDGASAIILMEKSDAIARNIPILATIKGFSEIGMEPSMMGYAPYHAVQALVAKTNTDINTVDRFELNEAFAAQSLAVIRNLGIDDSKVNVKGGAIALGHPIGASGARIMVTLVHELIQSKSKTGIASLCIGGGMGVAMLVEREKR